MRTFIVCLSLVFCCLAIGCTGWVYRIPTGNMIPTIQIGDSIVVNKYAYSSDKIERFDIVVFKAPEEHKQRNNNQDTVYAKRIIGLPNEKLEIRNNKIYINDKLLDEPFEKIVSAEDFKKNLQPIKIPENEYFMLGDNRPNSEDSRYWKKATVKKEDILGKIVEIIPQNK